MIKSLVDRCIERSRPVLLLLTIILIWGCLAYINIPKEDNPDVQIPIIGIQITLPGILTEEVENFILKPLEKNLKTVSNIKKITSYAATNGAEIIIEFPMGIDIKNALINVRDKVNQSKKDLPKDIIEPYIYEINLSEFPVLSLILFGDLPEKTLNHIARDLKDKLSQIPELLEINLNGKREDEIEILITPDNIKSFNLQIDDLTNVIGKNSAVIAAGNIENQKGSFSFKVPSFINNIHDILNLPIKVKNNQIVKLSAIAEIRDGFKNQETIVKVNGKKVISIDISKRIGANIIDTIAKIKDLITKEEEFLPKNLKILYAFDTSEDIKNSLEDLENNIFFAALLSLLPIIYIIGFRSALLVTIALPCSFIIGILIIRFLGYSLNMVVIFSLILSIGMLVDAAIIICEYADRKIIENIDHKKAYSLAVSRMFWPVIGSTLTALIVFVPLFFWPGIVGEFMKFLPITIISTVLGSIITAFIFIPVIASLFPKPAPLSEQERLTILAAEEGGDLNNLGKYTRLYIDNLVKVLKTPWRFIISVFSILIISIAAFSIFGPGVEFFPKVEPKSAKIKISSPGNLSILEKDQIVSDVYKKIKKYDNEIKIFYLTSGQVDRTKPHIIGSIQLEFVNWKKRRNVDLILSDIKKDMDSFAGISIETIVEQEGPGGEKAINIEISSRFPENLAQAALKVTNLMNQMGTLQDIENNLDNSSVEWEVNIDFAKALTHGVDYNIIGSYLRLFTSGHKIGSFRPVYADEEVDIMLKYPSDKQNFTYLNNLMINSKFGLVAVSNFLEFKPVKKVDTLTRINGLRTITISANNKMGIIADEQVKKLQSLIKKHDIDPSIQIKFVGDTEDMKENQDFLSNAFFLSLLSIALILLIQFNSFFETIVIMSAIFLSTAGVMLGLLVTYQPFGIVMCSLGIIALAGVVVSNNIIYIDTYKDLRSKHIEVKEALIRTGSQRLRPILLTAGIGIIGLLPLVFGINIDILKFEITIDAPSSQWWRQLSTTIAGGHAFSTILTLFLTPCLLLLKDSGRLSFKKISILRKIIK